MIYHYTTIETLALILDSKKIRFNNLTNVDDMLEGDLFEKASLAQHIFVSCWTKDIEENVALWKMYTLGKGVRIGVPSNPWRKLKFSYEEWKFNDFPFEDDQDNDNSIPFEFNDVFGDHHMICPPFWIPNNLAFAKEVEYHSEEELKEKYKGLYSEVEQANGQYEISIMPLDFGRHKHRRWEFQKEYRFVLFILPLLEKIDFSKVESIEFMSNHLIDHLKNDKISPLKDFYVSLDQESLDNMEIMIGPLCSPADEILVNSLMAKYNIQTTIQKSKLSIRK